METETLLDYKYIYKKGESKMVFLLLHGTGGDEYDLLPLADAIDREASILSVRGNVVENGYNRFFERFAEGVFNEEDIRNRADNLVNFIEEAKKKHALEDAPFIAIGYSNGANIAAAILLLHPNILSGSILFRAMLPLQPDVLPDLSATPILLSTGTNDAMIPREKAEELGKKLSESRSPLTHHHLAAGHALTPKDIEEARNWFDKNYR